jgi:conjugative relaxase-like TrwC/TraI family protein
MCGTIQGYQNIGSGQYFMNDITYYQKQFIADARKNFPQFASLTDEELMKNEQVRKEVKNNPLAPVWIGKIASHLGIEGHIADLEGFTKACAGYTPTSDLNNNPVKLNSEAFEVIDGQIQLPTTKEEERRVGMEIIFTTASQWNDIWAIGSAELQDEMTQIKNEALAFAFAEMERDAIIRKGENGQVYEERAAGLLAVPNNHIENRGPAGGTPEPFGHTHLVIMNTAMDKEGNFYALLNDSIAKNKAHYNALYSMKMAELARERLGFELEAKYIKADERERNPFKQDSARGVLTLVPKLDDRMKKLAEIFGRRSKEINQTAKEEVIAFLDGQEEVHDDPSSRGDEFGAGVEAKRIAQLTTKNKKTDIPISELRAMWKQMAKELDPMLDENYIKSFQNFSQAKRTREDLFKSLEASGKTMDQFERELIESYHDYSKEVLTREPRIKSFFAMKMIEYTDMATAQQEAERIFSKHFAAKADERTLRLHDAIVSNKDNLTMREQEDKQLKFSREVVFIDRKMEHDEKECVADYNARRTETNFVISHDVVASYVREIEIDMNKNIKDGEKRKGFTPEQLIAIYNSTTKTGGLVIVEGIAGGGKSFQAKATKKVYEKAGFKVIAVGTSAKNTKNLAESIESQESMNTSKLLSILDSGKLQLDSKTVIIADEMGMLDQRGWTRLSKHINKAGAKLIAMGQSSQLKAVGAGDTFKVLSGFDFNTTTLKEVFRQKEDWQKQATQQFSNGSGNLALRAYYDNGMVDIGATNLQEARERAVNSYFEAKTDSKVIITDSNESADLLNQEIRKVLIEKNALSQEAITINTADFGEKEFRVRDKVMFLGSGTTQFTNEGKVYKRKPGKKEEPAFGLLNGEEFTVVAVDAKKNTITLQNENGTHTVKADQTLTMTHGYAYSIHKSQGQSLEFVIPVPTKAQDLNMMYVAMSRHQKAVNLILNEELKGEATVAVQKGKPLPEDVAFAKDLIKSKGIKLKEGEDVGLWTYGKVKKFIEANSLQKKHPMDDYENVLMAATVQAEKKTTYDYEMIETRAAARQQELVQREAQAVHQADQVKKHKAVVLSRDGGVVKNINEAHRTVININAPIDMAKIREQKQRQIYAEQVLNEQTQRRKQTRKQKQ